MNFKLNDFFSPKKDIAQDNYLQTRFVLSFILIFCFLAMGKFVNWQAQHHPFVYDVNQYYSYLIAYFKHDDIAFSNGTYHFWLQTTPTNHLVPKVTYGMSLFYLPFFLFAELFSAKNSTGYESIYAWSVHIGCIIYVLIGLYYCRKTLLIWLEDKVVSITLLIIFFGSNLFCYTLINAEFSHSILFFLISIFVFYVVKWFQTKQSCYFLMFSFLLGLITIVRPTEIIVAIFPLVIGVYSKQGLKEKLNDIFNLRYYILIAVFLFFLPIFPQLLYWRIQSGQWLFFSYGESERFFWTNPQIVNVLFSYRKGWLVYSPLMILSLLGFIPLWRRNKRLFFGIILYFIINLYLISAWWDWAYGGSFGMRALVQSYALLAIPMAYCIIWIINLLKSKWKQLILILFISFFCFLNIFQSNLYKHAIISYDGMTKEAYWYTFLKRNYSEDDLKYLETLIKHPNYDEMRKGNRD